MAMKFERQCPECGKINYFQQSQALFCPPAPGQNSPSCKRAWNNRNTVQGGPLIPLLKAWRKARHAGKGNMIGPIVFTDICLALDKMIAEDKEAGRPNPLLVMEQRYRSQGLASMLEPNQKPFRSAA